MESILIIGSEGFIGGSLVKFYINKGWAVTGIDRTDNATLPYNYYKLFISSDITELLLKRQFGYIVNAAGSGNVGFSMEHPLGDYNANCSETAVILEALRISKSQSKYLHISSAAVYGNPNRIPVHENDATYPLSPYGWHKLISEILCKEYFAVYGIATCLVRPFSVYGPGLRKQLFWDTFHKAINKSSVELYGTGNESRDFIFITDLVQAFDILLEKAVMQGECYNVASGTETSISNVSSLFLKHFTSVPKIYFNGNSKAGDPLNWKADINKISDLGFKTEISIEIGVEKTFNWIQRDSINNYKLKQ